MDGRRLRLTALDQEEGQAVVGSHERAVDVESFAVIADRLVVLVRLGKGDGNVLQHADVGWVVAQRQAVGGQRGVEIPLPFESQGLVQVIQALRPEITAIAGLEETIPEGHS